MPYLLLTVRTAILVYTGFYLFQVTGIGQTSLSRVLFTISTRIGPLSYVFPSRHPLCSPFAPWTFPFAKWRRGGTGGSISDQMGHKRYHDAIHLRNQMVAKVELDIDIDIDIEATSAVGSVKLRFCSNTCNIVLVFACATCFL